ncbi:asparaginase [Aliihoeflea aestuarii]|jgi:L-asparaginase|uniref:asparaginase n=1 Tax=Aliihoeflea aestuarii TaxID=453840 RepID=UPI002093BD9D|nr:asparaginase [Aliihoeflea aestuarii]MCO6390095.1 asparaginase [Aliihoeflea aestuarii]
MASPSIGIIGAGGTISSLASDPRDYLDYPETGRKLSVEEVLERLPELDAFADLVPIGFRSVGSSAIGPSDWLRLHQAITTAVRHNPAIAGFVILHGTATLEETAYFLSLTLPATLPVVVVGAQRPLNTVSSDAAANAINAVRVAADPASYGRGVMVVMNDEIHAARDATKGSTYRLHAFHSAANGPIGFADPDRVVFRFPAHPPTSEEPAFDVDGMTELPRVDIAYSYAGCDGAAVEAFRAAGAAGIVSAAFAPGIPAPLEREALCEAARAGTVIVQSSRVGQGRVARRGWLDAQGWVAAGDLSPVKARILLSLALRQTTDIGRIQDFFDRY